MEREFNDLPMELKRSIFTNLQDPGDRLSMLSTCTAILDNFTDHYCLVTTVNKYVKEMIQKLSDEFIIDYQSFVIWNPLGNNIARNFHCTHLYSDRTIPLFPQRFPITRLTVDYIRVWRGFESIGLSERFIRLVRPTLRIHLWGFGQFTYGPPTTHDPNVRKWTPELEAEYQREKGEFPTLTELTLNGDVIGTSRSIVVEQGENIGYFEETITVPAEDLLTSGASIKLTTANAITTLFQENHEFSILKEEVRLILPPDDVLEEMVSSLSSDSTIAYRLRRVSLSDET